MLTPSLLIYSIFVIIPIVVTIYLSFTDYSLVNKPSFIGLSNYKALVVDDTFWTSVKNTCVYAFFTIAFSMIIGLLLAVALNGKVKGKKIFRTIFYMPNVISVIASSLAWLYIYDSTNGILNMFMKWFGLQQQEWLLDIRYSLGCIIVMSIWQTAGYNMVVYLSGLQTIPDYLYEAAELDGASKIRQFFSITVPMLTPTTFFLVVMSFIFSFQVFGQVYAMTSGGPMNSTTTIVHQIYKNGFEGYKMGYASSISVFLLLVTGIITLINFKFADHGGDTEIA
jgi:multiple sugar transport system permease protein/raffinose/stachyose/melibiose transport system permease protein